MTDEQSPIGDFPDFHLMGIDPAKSDTSINITQLQKSVKKIERIVRESGLCLKCPDRYHAMTKGHQCCIFMED